MGPFVCRLVEIGSIALLAGCASAPASRPIPPPPPAATPAPAQPADRGPPATGETALTAATVPTTAPEPEWNDAAIVAVLVAAADGDAREADAALDRSRGARVHRFAEHMRSDDRVLGERIRALAQRLGLRDSATRLEVDVERTGYLNALREVPEAKVESTFLRAQTVQCASLVHAIDTELLGAARDPELIAILREVRAGALHHLETAREIQESTVRTHADR